MAHGLEGIIAYWYIPEGGATRDVFFVFMSTILMPALRGQNRCITMDNLPGIHKTDDIDLLLQAEGHQVVYRCEDNAAILTA